MGSPQDRILIVENDSTILDRIGRQVLEPLGYQVELVLDAAEAVSRAAEFQPDVVVTGLKMAGLSGKDLLVALASQGIQAPTIVVARKDMQADIIQAFRLGASDYLPWPAREPAIISTVERVLEQVHERQERENITRKLQETNQELKARMSALNKAFNIGKAVTRLAQPQQVYDQVVYESTNATGGHLGWLLVRETPDDPFILQAQRGLPPVLSARLHQIWDDGLSDLVASTGKSFSSAGNSFKRFKLSSLGQAALVVPIKTNKQVSGILVVMRKTARPFSPTEQALLEVTAEYTSVMLENLRKLPELETIGEQNQSAKGAGVSSEPAYKLAQRLSSPLDAIQANLSLLLGEKKGKLTPEQKRSLVIIQEKLSQTAQIVARSTSSSDEDPRNLAAINMNDMSRQALARFHRTARQNGLTLSSELASPPVMALGEPLQFPQVLDGLLSNAVKFSRPGGRITLRTGSTRDQAPCLTIQDTGIGIEPKQLKHIFDLKMQKCEPVATFPAGNCLGLPTIYELIIAWGGKLTVDSQLGKGSSFQVSLQPAIPPATIEKHS